MDTGGVWTLAFAIMLTVQVAAGREWSSRDGTFTAEAELSDVRDGMVILHRADGGELSVPLKTLSLRDIRYVEEKLREAEQAVLGRSGLSAGSAKTATRPGGGGPGGANMPGPAAVPSGAAASPGVAPSASVEVGGSEGAQPARPPRGSADTGLPPSRKASIAGMKRLALPSTSPWVYEPDLVPAGSELKSTVVLQQMLGEVRRVFFSTPPAAKMLVVATPFRQPPGIPLTRIPQSCARYDLPRGAPIDSLQLPFDTEPIDFASDGRRLMCRLRDGRDRLDFFALDDQSHEYGFRPYSELDPDRPEVDWAALVDERHLLTLNPRWQLVAWDLAECRALWSMVAPGGPRALSPTRRTLAVADGVGGLRLIDARCGDVKGMLTASEETTSLPLTTVEFAPDARRLAALYGAGDQAVLAVWDLTSGEIGQTCWLPAQPQDLLWAGPRHVLLRPADAVPSAPAAVAPAPAGVGGAGDGAAPLRAADNRQLLVIDVEKGIVVWRLEAPVAPPIKQYADGRFRYLAAAEGVSGARLIAAEPSELMDTAAAAQVRMPEPLLARGGSVRLVVNLRLSDDRPGAEDVQRRIKAILANRLKSRGYELDDSAETEMRVELDEHLSSEAVRVETDQRAAIAVRPLEIRCQATITKGDSSRDTWTRARTVTLRDGYVMQRDASSSEPFRAMPWVGAIRWCETLFVPAPVYPDSAHTGAGETRLTADGPVKGGARSE